jgi:hypothetical protein
MLEGLAPKEKEKVCVLVRRAAELEPADREILMAAMVDPKWSSNALSIALRNKGFSIHKNGVQEHRMKNCPCAK